MELDWLGQATLWAYLIVLSLLCVYGTHRLFLVLTFFRVRRSIPKPVQQFSDLPGVTVQLPMFNERYVAERIIQQACAIDYPRERLQIQVLDDSTDDTRDIASQMVARMREGGVDIEYIHREDRSGYKAGALENGLKTAKGDFVAIFDADFVPPPGILRETIHYFTDPRMGMVQCRWEHLNRTDSLLTQAQAILLDGHFMIEHTARNRTGRYMSFNGTAGVWRKAAIADAGGWSHDTLTEDLDLSYRAQMRGWQFVFLPQITSPAELPPEMNAFKAQQHRWTKGGAQVCVKMLPSVLASNVGWRVKLEAFFHLSSCMVYVLMVLLSLLVGPAMLYKVMSNRQIPLWEWMFDFLLFLVGTGSALSFSLVSHRQRRRSWWEIVCYIPALMAIGIGIAFNNAIAAIDGFFTRAGEFVRTPKFGDKTQSRGTWQSRLSGFAFRGAWKAWAELGLSLYLLLCLGAFFFLDHWVERVAAALPFLGMFIFGYAYVAFQTFYGQWLASRRQATPSA